MRNIECNVTLKVRDEAGIETGTRTAVITGRVYEREPTESEPLPWQLHDYRATVDGVELVNISGEDGDAIKAQVETYSSTH